MPLKPDLSFSGLEEFTSELIVVKPVAENSEAKASEAKPKAVRKNNGAPIIEDWVSDNEEDDVPQAKIEKKTFKPSFAKIEFVKPKQQEKTARKTVNHCDAQGNMTGEHSIFTDFKKLMEDIVACGGLPSKLFENDQTCVACQKGKQHRASCKSKTISSISQPLHMLHMDLFGPTFVKSLMKKMYYLVVTDDYSRFSWVFFLATKDETSGILKSFITRVENLIDQKVKVIRCDNGTEFKNKEMDQFCERKGIKREFSVARTSQQNGVAERKNRTLIEVARTMLADSKLPTTFWAEAVNTACYVQNRVLVTKPHNKTPYELFLGRKLALSFMKPFGCPVTILNTIDHLGKFDGKVDKGFFIGTKSSPNAGFKPSGDDEKKVTEEPRKEGGDPRKDSEFNDQEKENSDITTRDVFSQATLLHIEGMLFPLISPDYIPGFPGTRSWKWPPGDIQLDFDQSGKLELRESRTQIAKLQRKQMGNNSKIALAHFRIANLEQIIEDIQARHQADKESLLNAIYELKNSQEGPSDY
ncbi:putative ribonuclease H-like domain-containing protein [Tanacetum coccineum]